MVKRSAKIKQFKYGWSILYTYIRITHYKSFSAILLICNVSTSSTNCQMTHHSQLSNNHYIMSHNLA
jgi:hypothetical protein